MGTFLRGLMIVVGVLMLLAGAAVALYVGPDDEVRLGTHQVGPDEAPLLVTQPAFFEYRDVTVTVRAESPGGVFVGAAPAREIADYASGVRGFHLDDFDTSGRLSGKPVKGGDVPDPSKADFWSERASGAGVQRISILLGDQPTGFAVVPTKPGQGTKVALGIVLGGLFLTALVVALLGVALVVGAIVLSRRARGRRDAGRAVSDVTPASPDPEAAAEPVRRSSAGVRSRAGRTFGAATLAGGLVLGLGGCFSVPQQVGDDDPADPPALADKKAADSLLEDYDRRNNAAIARAENPPYVANAWARADTGSVLERDRYDTAVGKVKRTKAEPYKHQPADRYYVPAPADYPLWVISVGGGSPTQKKKGSKLLDLQVLSRARAVQPWLEEASVGVRKDALPAPLAPGEDPNPSTAQVRQARTLAGQLVDYWQRGRKPAGFTPDKGLRAPVAYARTLRASNRAALERTGVSTQLFGEEAEAVRVVRVQGGALAVATYRTDVVLSAKPGIQLNFNGLQGKVYGTDRVTQLTQPGIATAAWLIPDSGRAKVIGSGWWFALR